MPIPQHLLPYAGRWVAISRAQVVGAGMTEAEARAAGQLARPKDSPVLAFVPEPFNYPLPDAVGAVRQAVPDPARVWLVGGPVRDLMLQRRVHDLDFAVDGDGLAIARRAADALGAAFYPLDAERGVGRVVVPAADETEAALTLDFASLRGPDLYADLAGRDFALNALAVPLDQPDVVIDPLRGAADLRAKVIRLCAPNAIADDPVRAIRAVRLAAQLGFRLDAATRAAVKAGASDLGRVSAERQRDEFIRCLGGPRPEAAVRVLEVTGVLAQIISELAALKGVEQSPPHTLDVWEHTLATLSRLADLVTVLGPVHDVDAASDLTLGLATVRLGRYRQPISAHLRAPLSSDRPTRWLLFLAALLHDAAKPQTRSVDPDGRIRFFSHETEGADLAAHVLTRLRFSSDEVRHVRVVVENHMRPRQLSHAAAGQVGAIGRRAVYRFWRDVGAAGVDIVLLSLADFLAKFGLGPPPQAEWVGHVAGCFQLLEAYFEQREQRVAPPALISGNDLIQELGLAPGPLLGRLLEAVREAQATGEVTDRAAALAYARRLLDGPGGNGPARA